MEEQKEDKQTSTVRRDRLIEMQHTAQKIWADKKIYEANPIKDQKKYMITFPYPYVNGRLHMGHAFSFTKADFTARFKRLCGYNVLFAQGFHCTGMPIQAAADKIRKEIEEFGRPPVFPEKSTKNYQFTIMRKLNLGITDDEICKFSDPLHWLDFFPPYAQTDLEAFGSPLDKRRSFITTAKNPYYDSFIRWQFTILREQEKIIFGKRPSIFSINTQQMCADHDRSDGEGIGPQEYTLIKLKILSFNKPELQEKFKDKAVFMVAATLRPETMFGQTNCYVLPTEKGGKYGAYEMKDGEIFVCSERSALNMSYQMLTKNEKTFDKVCDIDGDDLLGLPLNAPLSTYDVVYSLPMMTISMDKGTGIVTSVPSDSPDDWATLRDLKQKKELREKYGITEQMVKVEPIPIIEIQGWGMLSAIKACDDFKVKSQNDKKQLADAKEQVYMKGFYEGVLKGANVQKYDGKKVQEAKPLVKQELIDAKQAVLYYEPEGKVIARGGDECIVALCDQWYLNYADQDWKNEVHEHMDKTFRMYSDVSFRQMKTTVDWLKEWGCSRSYGLGTQLPFDPQYVIESLSDSTIYMSYYTIVHYLQKDLWGKEPGTLGITPDQLNRETWDYIFLQKPYNEKIVIPEEKLKIMRDEFEYWYPLDLRVSAKDLIRNHLTMSLFNHTAIWKGQPDKWPRTFFVNGYILVNKDKMSKNKGNFFTIEDIITKFSADASRFGCAEAGDGIDDANFSEQQTEDSIVKLVKTEMWIKILISKEHPQSFSKYRTKDEIGDGATQFFDKQFENETKFLMQNLIKAYEEIKFRNVVKYGFHEFLSAKEDYLLNCSECRPRQDLILQWIHWYLLGMFPITPHFCEVVYQEYFLKMVEDPSKYADSMSFCRYPDISANSIDNMMIRESQFFRTFLHNLRQQKSKMQSQGANTKGKKKDSKKEEGEKEKVQIKKVFIIFAKKYYDWQQFVIKSLAKCGFDKDTGDTLSDSWKTDIKESAGQQKDVMTKSMQFGSFLIQQYKLTGEQVLDLEMPFDEEKLLKQSQSKFEKESGCKDIEFIEVNDAMNHEQQTIKNAAKQVSPGNATSVLF